MDMHNTGRCYLFRVGMRFWPKLYDKTNNRARPHPQRRDVGDLINRHTILRRPCPSDTRVMHASDENEDEDEDDDDDV